MKRSKGKAQQAVQRLKAADKLPCESAEMARFHGNGRLYGVGVAAEERKSEREKRIYWHSRIRQMSRNAQWKLLTLMLMGSELNLR